MSTATPVTFEPGNYVSTTNAEGFVFGARYSYQGREYRFALNANDVVAVIGNLAELASVALLSFTVTPVGQTSSIGRVPVGVFRRSVAKNAYCFLQVSGLTQTTGVSTAASPAIGNVLVADGATALGFCKVASAYTDKPIGTAVATASGGYVLAELDM